MFTNTEGGGVVAAPTKPKTTSPVASSPAASDPTAGAPGDGGSWQVTTPTFPGVQAVLGSDYGYQQLSTLDKAMNQEDLATANQRMAQMRAYYGSDTDPLSLLGRIYRSYQNANQNAADQLAARGMISSGLRGTALANDTLSYQQQEYDARFKLQQYIQGIHDSLRANERNRQLSEIQAAQNAIANWLNQNQPTVSWVTDPNTGQQVPVTANPAGFVPADQVPGVVNVPGVGGLPPDMR